jgi:hypothetical protein
VLIAPYAIDNISRFRLVGAVAMRGRGVIGRPQVINLRTGPLQTVAELVGSLPNSDHDNQEIITDRLRSQFVDHFH